MWVYSLANNRFHPRGVALGNLEAGQGAGFDDEVIHTELDILGFHLLQKEDEYLSSCRLSLHSTAFWKENSPR